MPQVRAITDEEFQKFRALILKTAGIQLSNEKKVLVAGRLNKRLVHYGLSTYAEYLRLLSAAENHDEFQVMVDLLTTNETYFFREPQHFEFLAQVLQHHRRQDNVRIWSAASSSGEEAYTIAMLLQETLGERPWSVLGSDISSRMLSSAQLGLYPMVRAGHVPDRFLKKYCLKGVRSNEGMCLISPQLKERVSFRQINLMQPLPNIGSFDVVFLRNVLIYFNQTTKEEVVKRILGALRLGGYLITGHSESLHGVSAELEMVRPSIYRKIHPDGR